MAKDGTLRGGKRQGAGAKPKAAREKILDGKAVKIATMPEAAELDAPDNLTGTAQPSVEEYMKDNQQSGFPLVAASVQEATWRWLRERNCDGFVTPQQVNQYSMCVARWVQCERAVSRFGFLAKHPTTGNPIPSPFVAMGEKYSRQATAVWFQIFSVVEKNCATEYSGAAPHESIMASLLSD